MPLLRGEAKDRFTEAGNLLGELELWYRMSQLVNGPFPHLCDAAENGGCHGVKAFYDRVKSLKGPSAWEKGGTKYGEIVDFWKATPEGA